MKFKLTEGFYRIAQIFIWLIYAVYAIISLMTLSNFDLKFGVLLCALLIHLTVMSFLKNWYANNRPLLLDWFRLATFVFIVLNFMLMINEFDKNIFIVVNGVVHVETKYALPSLLTVLCGLAALKIGEKLVFRSKLFKKRALVRKKTTVKFRNLNFFYFFTIIFCIIQLVLMANGYVGYGTDSNTQVSSFSFLLQITNILGPFILAIYATVKFFNKVINARYNLFFIIYLVIQVLLGFLSGMKEAIVIPLLIVLIPFLLSGKKVSRYLIIGVILFVVFLYPINNNYRNIINNTNTIDKVEIFKQALDNTFEKSFTENFISGSESYQERISIFPVLMYSVQNEVFWNEYKYLNRYIYLPIAWFAPRFLLPKKPVADIGNELYYKTTGRKDTSITPSTYGWAYFEGGVVPTFLAFLLFGVFITVIQLKVASNGFFGLVIYILILTLLLKVEADIYFKITGIAQTILIGYVMLNILFKQNYTNGEVYTAVS